MLCTISASAIVVVALSSCSFPSRGDRVADERVRALAEQIGEDMTPPVLDVQTAEWLAATYVGRANNPEQGIRVEALSWSGNSGQGDGAQIDVRISIDVPAKNASSIGDSSWADGSSTRCYRYHVIGNRYWDTLKLDEIGCPNEPAPPPPTASPSPALPADAETTLEALLSTATAASLNSDVQRAFPQDFISKETTSVRDELVAAIGVRSERECIVVVRRVDGSIQYVGFRPVWLEPGELGCSTAIYTNPPR